MKYILISGILFVVSIIAFLVKNRTAPLSLKQIIGKGSYNKVMPWHLENYPGIILMFSVVIMILFSPLPPLVAFIVGISIVFMQRLIIWIVLVILAKWGK